ncbi:peroxiredoxin [Qipengyuania sp. G39]|uniref:Thioredoxin peroxidase n=1 Tax=Qipengyuania profundimaris TaxID=3067652 RepID=A0ABT9HNU5_9SPHN|nr:peroxiredoxin [Qipengyuania sp. G39]MDP4574815.1 peroxiredoxin [Qipengyuania sp. G39]
MAEALHLNPSSQSLRIGDSAPSFAARSTVGPVELDDYRGKWVAFFSHPADFTPVCTSEFVALAKRESEFAERGCALIGLSVDSLFSHLAWLRLIRDKFDVEVRFPLLEDPTMVVGRAYGMIAGDDADSATIRSTYFIDPTGIIRAISTYPANVGRSISEMLRLLDALQAADREGALVPADWLRGEPLLKQTSTSLDDVFESAEAGGWFTEKHRP